MRRGNSFGFVGEAVSVKKMVFEVVQGWGELPEGWAFKQVAGVAVDSRDRVYVFNRGDHPVIVFDRDGRFLRSWGEGVFHSAHGIYIDQHDGVYCVDVQDHTVRKFNTDGRLLLTLGREGQPGEGGAPFNRPTNAALAPSGELYVADGYGNSRIHKFSTCGELILSWGAPGDGPGQFNIPHGVWAYGDDRVFVADRQNNRIQIFDSQGEFLTQWTDFRRPCSCFIDGEDNVYVAELEARMSILSIEGELLARWGGTKSKAPGEFIAPHAAWVDSRGDLYIGEVLEGQRIQKFVRRS